MIELREKLETIFVERARAQLERLSLAELLYHAVVECGEGCRLVVGEAMQGV